MMKMVWRGSVVVAIACLFLVLVACGDDGSDFATRPEKELSSSETQSSSSLKKSSSSSVVSSSSLDKSSSSVIPQSSSSETSVSSSSVPEGYVAPSTVVTGSMTDERDGRTYKTVTIGTQTWMAENLNFAYTGVPFIYDDNTSDSTSWCYDNDPSNCDIYGRLYTWAAAMDSTAEFSDNGNGCGYKTGCMPTYPVRGICPEGWHLPTHMEWNTLFTAVGDSSTAGIKLKSTSGWNDRGSGTGGYWFSALPAGFRYGYGSFKGKGDYANIWSSSAYTSEAFRMYLDFNYKEASLSSYPKYYGFAVRCLKDSSATIQSSSTKSNSSAVQAVVDPSTVVTGTLTDERDGQTYKTVTIGTQTWMAENLNYDYKVGSSRYGTHTYTDDGETYGRYYTWAAAMDFMAEFSTNASDCGYNETCTIKSPARGICPEGWHIPTSAEWSTFYYAIGGSPYAMQAKGYDEWSRATDAYGFSALPADEYCGFGSYDDVGSYAYFWSASGTNSPSAYYWILSAGNAYLLQGDHIEDHGFSVRCIKDEI